MAGNWGEGNHESSFNKQTKSKKSRYILGFLIVFIVIATVAIIVVVMKHKETIEKEISIEEFFSQKKLAFHESLGVENVDLFPQVNEAQKIVEATKENADADELDNAKREVQLLLMTPKSLVETFNKNERFDLQAYEDLQEERLKFQRFYEIDFNETLQREVHDKSTKQYEEIMKAIQEGEVTGGESLDKLLGSLREQGYMLVNYGIDQDPQWLLDHIENWEGIQGDETYLRLLTDTETANRSFEKMDLLSMEEITDTLLKLEEIYNTYKDDNFSSWARLRLSWHATQLLELYIRSSDTKLDERKSELEGFLANHQDSIYWSIIDQAVQDYRSNDWQHTDYKFPSKLIIMFDDHFSGVQADDIMSATRWPLDRQTQEHLKLLTESNGTAFLNELSPFQVISLYLYSIERGEIDDAITLYDSSIIDKGTGSLRQEMLRQSAAHLWVDLAYETEYVVEKKDKKEATVFFLKSADTPNEIAMKFILRKTNEGWKLLDITAK